MKHLLLFLLLAGLLGAGPATWQLWRYRRARRGPVQDAQPLLYPAATFHVLTLVRMREGADGLAELAALRRVVEGLGRGTMVYAGLAAFVAIPSRQLRDTPWDGAVLCQFASRRAYEDLATSGEYLSVLGRFAEVYPVGMRRPALLNLLLPLFLLALRARDLLTRRPPRTPFSPASPFLRTLRFPRSGEHFARLAALAPSSERAVVIINLIARGDRAQRSADRQYSLQMLGLFAECGTGPMHLGRAVSLTGEAQFDQLALVYYPGVDFLKRMTESTFFNDIAGSKQPGDTLALPTVPVLSRLEGG